MSALAAQPRQGRWLMTLADLALLLVGFFVVLHAAEKAGRQRAIAASMRSAFTGVPAVALEANRVDGFAAGDAKVPGPVAPLVAWTKAAAADPRTRILVTGHSDAGEADRTAGGIVLAAARAAAVAQVLIASGVVPTARIDIAAEGRVPSRAVDLTISYGPR